MADLTHLDAQGNARMVEVADKPITPRQALACGRILLSEAALDAVRKRASKKGDVLAIAQLAGIQGAKHTSLLIPLCHPLPLTGVDVQLKVIDGGIEVVASARATWRTGVEMEAMTAVSTALLTIYDMLKSIDRSMTIQSIQLLQKHGGRSGSWRR